MTSNPESIERARMLLKQLWLQHRQGVFERLEILERSSKSATQMDDGAREAARNAAHKLAGALGTFGFHQATEWARSSERIFEQAAINESDSQVLAENAANIRKLLEREQNG